MKEGAEHSWASRAPTGGRDAKTGLRRADVPVCRSGGIRCSHGICQRAREHDFVPAMTSQSGSLGGADHQRTGIESDNGSK
jgi:hypothetical protein